jgi:tetratricopeptide (TPR) repeat protein
LLTERGHQAVGIDVDETALCFARLAVPDGDFRQLSSDTLKSEPQPDVVVLVDVLGFCEEPRRLLWQLRQLAPQARLLLAEPRATPGQSLVAPQRQAFSLGSLKQALLRAGYRIEDSTTSGTFIVLSATPADLSAGRAFDRAFRARSNRAFDRATEALEPLALQAHSEISREVHLELAELYSERMDGEQASANYLSVLKADGNDAEALSGLAQLTLANGNPQDALGLALRAVELDPSSASAACSLGLAAERFSTGDALRAWQLAANLAPAEPLTLTRLAELASAVGHTELAICALERLRLYHADQSVDFYVTLAWLLLGVGRTQDAKLEAKVAYALAPESPEVQQLQDRFRELSA